MRIPHVRKLATTLVPLAALWVSCSPVAPSLLKSLTRNNPIRALDFSPPAPQTAQSSVRFKQLAWPSDDDSWKNYAGIPLSENALTQLARFGRVRLQWSEDQLTSVQVVVGMSKETKELNDSESDAAADAKVPRFALERVDATSPKTRPSWELRILNHSDRTHWDMEKVSLLPDRPLRLQELL